MTVTKLFGGIKPMINFAFRIAGTLALISTAGVQAAPPTASKPCITVPEARGLVAYILPSVIAKVTARCQATLPAGAALLTRGAQLASELELSRAANFPMARNGFAKFIDQSDKPSAILMRSLSDSQLRPVMEAAVEQESMSSFKPGNCADLDRIFATLQPLPAGNFVEMITQVMAVATRGSKEIAVCPT